MFQKLVMAVRNAHDGTLRITADRWWGRGDLNPHRIFIPSDFKSRASTDSATPPQGATGTDAAF